MSDTSPTNPGPAITCQGILLPLPQAPRYAEGHVLTAVEASTLNQTWAENLRNNYAPKLKAKLELIAKDVQVADLDPSLVATFRAEFLEYAQTYQFGFRTPRIVLDPVEHLAQKLAKETVLAALRTKGLTQKSIPAETFAGYVETLLAKRPDIRKEAARRIKAQKAVSEDILGSLGLDGDGAEVGADSAAA